MDRKTCQFDRWEQVFSHVFIINSVLELKIFFFLPFLIYFNKKSIQLYYWNNNRVVYFRNTENAI